MKGLEGNQKKLVCHSEFHREPVTFLKDMDDVLVCGQRSFEPVEAYGGIFGGNHARENYNRQCGM